MNIPLIFSAISIVFCVLFFFYFRSYIRRKTSAEQLLAEYRTEVYGMIADIDAATDRDSRLVEERIKMLESLLADTDKRIAVYLRELDRSRTGEALYTSLGRGVRTALHQPPPETAAGQENPSPALKEANPVPQAASRARAGVRASVRAGKKKQAAADNSTEKPRLKLQVAELAAEGLSPAQIASRLNVSRSEVELVLNLLKKS